MNFQNHGNERKTSANYHKGINKLRDKVFLIKGAGEKASAVAHCLYSSGLRNIVMTDIIPPRVERRGVSFCDALMDGEKAVCGVVSAKAKPSMESINRLWVEGKIAVLEDPESMTLQLVKPDILIDGVMAKRNTGTTIHDAPLVIALGPGFIAGKDCDFVVETNPMNPHLGRLFSEGQAEEHTGIPTPIMGLTTERLLRAPADGKVISIKTIGETVAKDETIGYVGSGQIKAQIPGCLWGLVRDGVIVKKGWKIGDIDPRGQKELCFEIADQAKAIAEGILKGLIIYSVEKNTK